MADEVRLAFERRIVTLPLAQILPLRQVPAAIRFISFEPLIGSVAAASLKDIHWAIVGGESGPDGRLKVIQSRILGRGPDREHRCGEA